MSKHPIRIVCMLVQKRHVISNFRRHDCLFNNLFSWTKNKTLNFYATGNRQEAVVIIPCAASDGKVRIMRIAASHWYGECTLLNNRTASLQNHHHPTLTQVYLASFIWREDALIANPIGSISIRHRSDTFASDRCQIDIDPVVFALANIMGHVAWWQLLGLLSYFPVIKSSHLNAF